MSILTFDKGKAIATILMPFVIALVGHLYTSSLKEREINLQFVELSIGILSEEPTPENKNLRGWAIDVINEHSDVKLKPEVTRVLMDNLRLNPGVKFDLGMLGETVQVPYQLTLDSAGQVQLVKPPIHRRRAVTGD